MSEQDVITAKPGEIDKIEWRYTIPPRTDSKLWLLTIGNVAVTGYWHGALGQYYKGWYPNPKRNKEIERQLFGSAT